MDMAAQVYFYATCSIATDNPHPYAKVRNKVGITRLF